LALAAFVYGFLYGFDGLLLRDYSIYLYSGQRVAEGIPPYTGVFDHKGPFSPLLAGVGVLLSKELGFLDDVYSVRVLFFLAGSFAVVAIYLLGKSAFGSRAAGIFAALTFLGFYAYAQPAASGPEPKTPMVLFEALSLTFSTNKRWFWGAFFGCLASLVWQPMAIFFLVSFFLAVSRPKEEERLNAVLKALAGIALPFIATLAYFYYYGALSDFMDGFFLFNVKYLVRGDQGGWPLSQLGGMVAVVSLAYGTMVVPIMVGLINIFRLYFVRPFEYRYAPLLLSLPAPLLWSLKDFQLADDFFVFLPYVAVGFGAFLASMVASLGRRRRSEAKKRRLLAMLFGVLLIGVALANTSEVINANAAKELKGTQIDLSQQREGALEIQKRLGGGEGEEEVKLASIGSPQALVLLEKKNPNPYLWITAGVDNEIEARVAGGFEGWVEGLKEAKPDGILFFGEGQSLMFTTHLTSEHAKELNDFLNSYYHVEKIGPWWLYVRGPK
jgi:hypothetical protein